MSADTRTSPFWAPWLAAGIGFAAMLYVFYPGLMSPDSASQWLEARTGNYTSAHPALMAMTWSLTERVLPGPGGLFVLHLLVFWMALAWAASELFERRWSQVCFVLVIGLWPPVTNMVAHLWKDVPMVGLSLLAVAALARDTRHPSRRCLAIAAIALVLACCYRHNALPLAIPFLWRIVQRWPRPLPASAIAAWKRPRQWLLTAALTLVAAALASIPNRLPQVTERPAWPLTAVWDLAAVSIAEKRMLIPESWFLGDLALPELEQAFTPWSNTPIFATNKLLITLFATPSTKQMSDLRAAWMKTMFKYPGAFAHHRLRLTAMLFGLMPNLVPPYLVFAPDFFQMTDNPPLERRHPQAQQRWEAVGHRLARTPIFAGWFYVALGMALALSAGWRSAHPLLMPILFSAALYMAPLPLIAPSAEFRYLAWPVLAILIALILRLTRETHDGRQATPR